MRRAVLMLGLALAVLMALIWATGGFLLLERWAQDSQRTVQNAMAGAIRQLKGGKPGALAALLAVSFGYGFFHAAGPGHGKLLIGGYGVGSRVRFVPLAAIAVAASLAQAVTAVLLVYAGVFVLGWTRERMLGVTEQVMAPVSYAAVAGIGLWLVWRGWRGVRRSLWDSEAGRAGHHVAGHDHHHTHDHGHARHDHPGHGHAGHVHDASCGHNHGPTLAEVAKVTGWRDAAALVAGVAIRPCTGALFVLILTWQMGIGAMGVLAALAMGLGTASVTLLVAAMAIWVREGALASIPGAGLARALPVLEIAAGGVIAFVATSLLIAAI